MHRYCAFSFVVNSALLCFIAFFPASAQDLENPFSYPDPINTVYESGLEPIPEAELRALPPAPTFRAFLPQAVDLSQNLPKPGNQGQLGSCASWAVGYAARGYYTNIVDRKSFTEANLVSPNFLYNLAHDGDCSQGSSLVNNVRVLQSGALSLRDYPYRAQCENIPTRIKRSASKFKVAGLTRLDTARLDDIRGQLANGAPVVVSMRITKSFHRLRGASTFDHDPLFDRGDFSHHAVVVVGYDDRRQALRIINSWGRGWGDKGYAWLDYDLAKRMIFEAIVLSVPGFEPVPPIQPGMREALGGLLVKLNGSSCGHVTSRTTGNQIRLDGFVGSDDDLELLRDLARRDANVALGDVSVSPWPQCELKQILAEAVRQPHGPEIELSSRTLLFAGEPLTFKVRAPDYFSYLYAAYVQADQSVVQIVQPGAPLPVQTAPDTRMIFGDGEDGRSKFTVSGPFGREALLIIASKSPLFEANLPVTMSARDYLSALRKALIYRPDPRRPPRIVSATVAEFQTRETRQ